jgi:glucose-6-phosphate 1-dehydrogenase
MPDSPAPHVLVLFGATGDLARRKLLPGLFHLSTAGLMPEDFRIIGSGRHEPDGSFADLVRDAVGDDASGDDWDAFAAKLSFVTSSDEDGSDLAAAVADARSELGDDSRVLLYLSVPPSAMEPMVGMLGACGLNKDSRIVMEKPFGHDLASAQELNATVHEHFDEEQVFRIDHFLGKEAAQDILALRFANGLFEPIWNAEHVSAVQIDVPEDLGLEGRASFYEETGALRDMVVTHLCQVLGFVAMEPPSAIEPEPLRDAKADAFRALQPLDPSEVVYGQFEGYRDEDGVDEQSTTETFAAVRCWVGSDRWKGVPFLLRTGKAMAANRRAVTLLLRDPPGELLDGDDDHRPDEIVIELTDDPQIRVDLRVKRPGPTLVVTRASLQLDVERELGEHGLEAYERLLHDVMLGDRLLFTRADEIERLWEVVTPVLEHPPEPQPYAKGSWGPKAADELAKDSGGWRLPEDG